jgi:hypothetical protein
MEVGSVVTEKANPKKSAKTLVPFISKPMKPLSLEEKAARD